MTLKLHSEEPVVYRQTVTPAGSRAFEVDGRGNVLAGPTRHVNTLQFDPDRCIAALFYSADTQRLFTHSLILGDIGDPPELVLGRTGPDNAPPDAEPTGATAGTGLGVVIWRGWSSTGRWLFNSAQIYARAQEDISDQGAAGSLHFAVTPLGGDGPEDVLAIYPNGELELAELATGNRVRIYARTNASGKTELIARFATSEQVFAAEP